MKTLIEIEALEQPNIYRVTVKDRITSIHEVKLTNEYLQHLTDDTTTADLIVRQSFEFLLRRLPNTSIPRCFDIAWLERQFPKFVSHVQKQLS